MKHLLMFLLFCLTVISVAQHTTMPLPVKLTPGQLKLNTAELKEAQELLKARVEMGIYLQRNGHITERTLKELQQDLEIAAMSKPIDGLQSYGTFNNRFPLYQQSDKAVASLGRDRILELYQEYKEKNKNTEQAYRTGKTTLIVKLRTEADWLKINKIYNNSSASHNDTLAPLPYFLQGINSLAKLEKTELNVLIVLAREEYNMARNQHGVDSPFTREAQTGLSRLEAASAQQ